MSHCYTVSDPRYHIIVYPDYCSSSRLPSDDWGQPYRISKGSYCLTWDGFQSVAPSPQSQDSRCSAVEDRQRSGSNQLGEIEWFWMICYSQPTLLRQERCFQIVQPLNLWSPKSPDKNLPLGVLKLVVEIGGPICCPPKKTKKSQWFQHWSFGWRGPINKQIALPNFKLLHCYRKKTFGHLTKPTNVVLFSSLPMAVDCRWRSLLHELTQATMTTGRRSFFGVGGYVVLFLFFTWHFGEGFFWGRNSSSCIFGFSGWWWSQLCFLCVFFIFTSTWGKDSIWRLTDIFSIGWLNHQLVGPSLDVTVGFDDWLFGSRLQPAATHPRFTNLLLNMEDFTPSYKYNDYRMRLRKEGKIQHRLIASFLAQGDMKSLCIKIIGSYDTHRYFLI